MFDAGLIKNSDDFVKVLGPAEGNSHPVTVIADRFSKSAFDSVKAMGGKAVALMGVSKNG